MAERASKNSIDNKLNNGSQSNEDATAKDVEDRLLLQDCNPWNLPRHAKQALEAAYDTPSKSTSPGDIIVVLAYTLMLECGFVPADVARAAAPSRGYHRVNVRQYARPPLNWRAHGCYLMRLALPTCPDDPVRLIAVPSESSLLLTVTDVRLKSGHSICLQPARYVVQRSVGDAVVLQNIRELAFKIKDDVCTPIRSTILNRIGVANPSLIGLPREILLYLLSYLNAPDLASLSMSCRRLRDTASDQRLWRCLVNKDFRPVDLSSSEEDLDWRDEYATRHGHVLADRRRRERRARAIVPHPAYFIT